MPHTITMLDVHLYMHGVCNIDTCMALAQRSHGAVVYCTPLPSLQLFRSSCAGFTLIYVPTSPLMHLRLGHNLSHIHHPCRRLASWWRTRGSTCLMCPSCSSQCSASCCGWRWHRYVRSANTRVPFDCWCDSRIRLPEPRCAPSPKPRRQQDTHSFACHTSPCKDPDKIF